LFAKLSVKLPKIMMDLDWPNQNGMKTLYSICERHFWKHFSGSDSGTLQNTIEIIVFQLLVNLPQNIP